MSARVLLFPEARIVRRPQPQPDRRTIAEVIIQEMLKYQQAGLLRPKIPPGDAEPDETR
ncbi:MAG: hypothetical protein U1E83_01235 [Methylotetracoccus sp.]